MNNHLTTIFTDGRKTTYKKGSSILSAHKTRDNVFYIQSGWVKVAQYHNTSAEKILTTLHTGNIFPFEWSHTDVSSVSFVSLEDTKILSLPLNTFKQKVMSNPEFVDSIMNTMTMQNQALINEITNLQYHTAREKIVLRLLSLAQDFGHVKENSVQINKSITNEYMSKSTSMSRETTSREMSRLIRERLIRHSPKGITIVDVGLLYDVLSKRGYNTCNLPRSTFTKQSVKLT